MPFIEKKIRAVVIDDVMANLIFIRVLGNNLGLEMDCFTDPHAALEHMDSCHVDILITDYVMDKMNGIDVVRHVAKKHPEIPILMITTETDEKLMLHALEEGASDFLKKPINLPEFRARVSNMMRLSMAQKELRDHNENLKIKIKDATQEVLKREMESLVLLARAAEYRDPHAEGHIARVAKYSHEIASKMGFSRRECDILYHAAPLHDIGKIGIPDQILLKPGLLDEEEFEFMKKHTWIGNEILKNSTSEYLLAGAEIALTHHERFDGTGYPNNLKGNEIPVMGRITAVADVFDALTTSRTYKQPWPMKEALQYLLAGSNSHFDPEIIRVTVSIADELREISEEVNDDNLHLNYFH